MKKSELKALIREVVEEVQNAELNQMINALKNNPEFVDAAMQKYGDRLNEEDMNRRSFIGKLAKVLAGAGIAASAVSTAKAGPMGDLMRHADAAVQKATDIANAKADELGYRTKDPVKGSTLDIIRKAKVDPIFKELREEYIDAMDNANIQKMEQIRLKTVQLAVERLKAANDFDKEKKFISGNVIGITKFAPDDVKEILKDHPEWLR